MCGLAGIILKKENRSQENIDTILDGFENMLLKANTRGGHATGFALIDINGNYTIQKRNVDAYKFLDTPEASGSLSLVNDNNICIMGHTRYATLGSPEINRNNHPIRAGKTIGTHNGSIHNHKQLFKKYNMKRFAQVDSEAIFRLYETSKSAKDFSENRLPNVRGRVSIVWSDLEYPEYIYMVKGNNPLELAFVPSLNIYVYGSTNEIIKVGNWRKIKPIKINPYTMLRINTRTLKIRSKKIVHQVPRPVHNSYFKFNQNIGAYEPVKRNYTNTVPNFVPRYSWKDKQSELFKKYKAKDGSTIRKVR